MSQASKAEFGVCWNRICLNAFQTYSVMRIKRLIEYNFAFSMTVLTRYRYLQVSLKKKLSMRSSKLLSNTLCTVA
jgi:hypothetical protein